MSTVAYQVREDTAGVGYLRPLLGGNDRAFSTRYRDVQVGVTKPTASNTGTLPGFPLRAVQGGANTIPGVYEDLDISGGFVNQAAGLTVLRNCRIRRSVAPTGATGVVTNQRPEGTLVLVDCDVSANVASNLITGVLGGNLTAIRCHVHDCVDMFGIYAVGDDGSGPTNSSVLACYGHDLTYYSPDPGHDDNRTHNDGIQLQGGAGLLADGNRFDMVEGAYSTVAAGGVPSGGLIGQGITITPSRGDTRDFIVRRNWLDHGIRGIITGGSALHISGLVENNRFGANIVTDPSDAAQPHGPIVTGPGHFTGFPTASGSAPLGNVYDADATPVPVYLRGS